MHWNDYEAALKYVNGIDGNGGKGGFSEMEALQLRSSLIDLSERIRRAADEVF